MCNMAKMYVTVYFVRIYSVAFFLLCVNYCTAPLLASNFPKIAQSIDHVALLPNFDMNIINGIIKLKATAITL